MIYTWHFLSHKQQIMSYSVDAAKGNGVMWKCSLRDIWTKQMLREIQQIRIEGKENSCGVIMLQDAHQLKQP